MCSIEPGNSNTIENNIHGTKSHMDRTAYDDDSLEYNAYKANNKILIQNQAIDLQNPQDNFQFENNPIFFQDQDRNQADDEYRQTLKSPEYANQTYIPEESKQNENANLSKSDRYTYQRPMSDNLESRTSKLVGANIEPDNLSYKVDQDSAANLDNQEMNGFIQDTVNNIDDEAFKDKRRDIEEQVNPEYREITEEAKEIESNTQEIDLNHPLHDKGNLPTQNSGNDSQLDYKESNNKLNEEPNRCNLEDQYDFNHTPKAEIYSNYSKNQKFQGIRTKPISLGSKNPSQGKNKHNTKSPLNISSNIKTNEKPPIPSKDKNKTESKMSNIDFRKEEKPPTHRTNRSFRSETSTKLREKSKDFLSKIFDDVNKPRIEIPSTTIENCKMKRLPSRKDSEKYNNSHRKSVLSTESKIREKSKLFTEEIFNDRFKEKHI